MRTRFRAHASALCILLAAFGLGVGCAGISHLAAAPGRIAYDYFTHPNSDDAWTPKIAGWQARESAEDEDLVASAATALAGVAEAPEADTRGAAPFVGRTVVPDEDVEDLRTRYFQFRADRKRRMARAFAEWIQTQAPQHYVADGPIDHWATLEETLQRDGDDCDGLELLAFHGLRDLGFDPHEVYRAIVYRRSDGQHHMVTLWFENPTDPWVIDPTGAMARGLTRMSDLSDWVPLKVFSESVEYTVRPRDEVDSSDSAIASNR